MDHMVYLNAQMVEAAQVNNQKEFRRIKNELRKDTATRGWLLKKLAGHVKSHGC